MSQYRYRVVLFLKGMAMGAADSVPGVSGGTVALITHIYEELIYAIKSIGWKALLICKKEGFGSAWRHIKGDFLLTLVSGILLSLLLLSRILLFLLENYLPHLLSFFCGLVIASILFVMKKVNRWTPARILLLLTGAALASILTTMPSQDSEAGLLYYFFSGAIAICAMILPGISGAFILVLLGTYGSVLEALVVFDWQVIIVFVSGCIFGLLLFTRLLAWLLQHHHEPTLALLTGMLVGSLYMLWPWRIASEITLSEHAFTQYEHVLPDTYVLVTGMAFPVWSCMGLVITGVVLVLALEVSAGNLADKGNQKSQDIA